MCRHSCPTVTVTPRRRWRWWSHWWRAMWRWHVWGWAVECGRSPSRPTRYTCTPTTTTPATLQAEKEEEGWEAALGVESGVESKHLEERVEGMETAVRPLFMMVNTPFCSLHSSTLGCPRNRALCRLTARCRPRTKRRRLTRTAKQDGRGRNR